MQIIPQILWKSDAFQSLVCVWTWLLDFLTEMAYQPLKTQYAKRVFIQFPQMASLYYVGL